MQEHEEKLEEVQYNSDLSECKIKSIPKTKLTAREHRILFAAIRLNNIDLQQGYVPHYELIENKFRLTVDEMREIRDIIQALHGKGVYIPAPE